MYGAAHRMYVLYKAALNKEVLLLQPNFEYCMARMTHVPV